MDLIYNSANTINQDEQQDEQDNDDNNEDKINDGAVDLSDFQNDHFYTKN
ncbi:unnamed protein product, partial [Rotaria magnacalcarata]